MRSFYRTAKSYDFILYFLAYYFPQGPVSIKVDHFDFVIVRFQYRISISFPDVISSIIKYYSSNFQYCRRFCHFHSLDFYAYCHFDPNLLHFSCHYSSYFSQK